MFKPQALDAQTELCRNRPSRPNLQFPPKILGARLWTSLRAVNSRIDAATINSRRCTSRRKIPPKKNSNQQQQQGGMWSKIDGTGARLTRSRWLWSCAAELFVSATTVSTCCCGFFRGSASPKNKPLRTKNRCRHVGVRCNARLVFFWGGGPSRVCD